MMKLLVAVFSLMLAFNVAADVAVEGIAAYYSDVFQGKKTASGEIYDKSALTAAHKTLAFGTQVKVTNLDNGMSVTVVINDRGPYSKDRIIDLSRAAAAQIDMIKQGIVPVRMEILD
jgi:rare lipoprotein A